MYLSPCRFQGFHAPWITTAPLLQVLVRKTDGAFGGVIEWNLRTRAGLTQRGFMAQHGLVHAKCG